MIACVTSVTRVRASASTQSQSPPRVRSAESAAPMLAEAVERRVTRCALHDRLDLGSVLELVGERRQRHLRLPRLAIAQDQQAIGRNELGQHLSAQGGGGQR